MFHLVGCEFRVPHGNKSLFWNFLGSPFSLLHVLSYLLISLSRLWLLIMLLFLQWCCFLLWYYYLFYYVMFLYVCMFIMNKILPNQTKPSFVASKIVRQQFLNMLKNLLRIHLYQEVASQSSEVVVPSCESFYNSVVKASQIQINSIFDHICSDLCLHMITKLLYLLSDWLMSLWIEVLLIEPRK